MESAKRAAPIVQPVIADGVRYEPLRRALDHGFRQHGGVVAAVDEKTGELLWAVQLYTTEYDTQEERDAQDVDVKTLALDESGHALLATDGRRRTWAIDLDTRAVTQRA